LLKIEQAVKPALQIDPMVHLLGEFT